MTPLKNFITLTLLATSLYSCDCTQIAKANVFDATTKQPIDSVKISKKFRAEQNTLTNADGFFELHSISGGRGDCPMTVVLTKKGYQTKTVDVPSDTSIIIYLDKN